MSSPDRLPEFYSRKSTPQTGEGKPPTKAQTDFMRELIQANYAKQMTRPTFELNPNKSSVGLDSNNDLWPKRQSEHNSGPSAWLRRRKS